MIHYKRPIGGEIANSSVKFVSSNNSIYYPNTLRKIDDDEVNMVLKNNKKGMYLYNGETYEVGVSNANGTGGKERNYGSKDFKIQAAISLSQLVEIPEEALYIVYGVPATSVQDHIIKQIQDNLLGKYKVKDLENNVEKTFQVEDVKVLAQPVGTLFSLAYDFHGNPTGLDPRKNYLIIDIGWSTTDLVEVSLSSGLGEKYTLNTAMSDYNRLLQDLIATNNPTSDVRSMYRTLYDLDLALQDSDKLLVRGGDINVRKEKEYVKKQIAKDIYETINNNGLDFSKYHNIILTGGGCKALENTIKNTFPAKYANDIILVEDSVMSNAKGFYIFARKHFKI